MSDLLDALSYVGDSLDKPGRAIRGALSGKTNELAAFIPFSDTLGITNESDRTSGSDLLRSLGVDVGSGIGGTLAGIGAEIATDPLTFGGGLLGRIAGKSAEAAAAARGPRYSTSSDDLGKMLGEYAARPITEDAAIAGRRTRNILDNPESSRLLSEIHPGSKIIGAGAEGIAFGTPSGDVLRIGRVPTGAEGRPIAEGILPTTRTVDVPYNKSSSMRVERTPLAGNVGKSTNIDIAELQGDLGRSGIDFFDAHQGNVGRYKGKDVVIDPGSIDTLPEFAGKVSGVTTAREPSMLMRALLSATGGDNAMRAAVESGKNNPELANLMMQLGIGTGATIGATSRL